MHHYNETIALLSGLADSDDDIDEPKSKKRRSSKPYSGDTVGLADCVDLSPILRKISKIFPEIVSKTKVLTLSIPAADTCNRLQLECEPKNQLNLIGTLITAISTLDAGDYIILEGFPLFTR